MSDRCGGSRAARPRRHFLPFALLALLAAPAVAQTPTLDRTIRVTRSDQSISVDGRLDEPAWAQAEISTGFWQRDPFDRVPATEQTEIQVVVTESALYFGIFAQDSEPEGIIAKEMERDARLDNDDSIAILIDTFHDRRNGYVFETNPNGARTDILITDEGRDINREWNGVWASAARRNDQGWVAEIAIPFTTLRFDRTLDTWGFNVRRLIRRKNEETNWTQLTRDVYTDNFQAVYALFRVSLAGELTGLEDLRASRQLDIKPYGLASAEEEPQVSDETVTDVTGGVDVKWGVTKSLALDLTYNTDFAEVEVDNLQINLTRFSLFFPEKREFFLENAGIFDFGPPQRETFEPTTFEVFFSRRIGLDRGEEVPIDYGGRLTGRIGGWNLGVMNVLTDAVDEEGRMIPETSFSVGRVKRNVGRRSSVGLIVTDRDEQSTNRNTVVGIDFDYKPTDKISFHFFDAMSDDDRVDDDQNSYGAGFAYQGRNLIASYDHQEVEQGFVPGMGFLLRGNDYTRNNPRIRYLPRVEKWGMQTWYLAAAMDQYDRSSDGVLESRLISIWPVGTRSFRGDAWRGAITRQTEQLFVPFEIHPGVVIPPGRYDFDGWNVGGRTNFSRPVAFSGQMGSGEFYDGDQDQLRVTMAIRASRFFRSTTGFNWNDVDLPQGKFTTKLYSQKFDFSFTPDLRLNALAQYNDVDDFIGVNLRFNWTYRPGSDLYVVYNHNWTAMDFSNRLTTGRQLIVKMTYLFQI